MTPLTDLARSMFAAALAAVGPDALSRRITFLPDGIEFGGSGFHPAGRLHLVALGKAAPGLAAAFLHRSQRPPDSVHVLAPEGVPTPASVVPFTRQAGHPFPDARGAAATRELLAALAAYARDDGVVLLLSGGSSALLAETLPGVTGEEVAALTSALAAAGTPIRELNAVRKHLLAAAGGRLALGCRAPILTLVLSDVPGDELACVGSGPTVADPTTFTEAVSILERRGLASSFPGVKAFLAAGARGEIPESPKPGEPFVFSYTMHWYGDDSARPPAGRVIATRRDRGTVDGAYRFVVEFTGKALEVLPPDTVLRGVVSVTSGQEAGELIDQRVVKNPATGGWRLTFQVRPKKEPAELRAFLDKGGDTLTETWSYVILP